MPLEVRISEFKYYKNGNTYADWISDSEESPFIIDLIQISKTGDASIIDEYDGVAGAIALFTSLGREPSCEEEYKAFTDWLNNHEGLTTVIVSQEVYNHFFIEDIKVADGYMDLNDGMYKFCDGCNEENDPEQDDPDDCYCE